MSEYNNIEEEKNKRKRKNQYKKIKKSRKQQTKIEKPIEENELEKVSVRIDSGIKKIESVNESLLLREKQITKVNSSKIIPFHSRKRKKGEKKPKKLKKKRKKEKKDILRKKVVYSLSRQEKQRLLENAIDRLSQDIRLLFLALFNVYKNTSKSAIEKTDNRYTKGDLFRDASEYMLLKFPSLNSEEFESLWEEFLRIFEKRAKYDVLLGFSKKEGGFQEKEKSLIYLKHKNAILEEIFRRIDDINDFEKKIVYLFLNLRNTLSFSHVDLIQLSITEIKKQFNLIFNGFMEIDPFKLLTNLGILFFSTWISTNKNNYYMGKSYSLPDYLEEISKNIISKLLKEIELPNLSENLQDFKNKFDISNSIAATIQYVALDYILNNPNSLSDLNTFLNNVRVEGSKRFLDFPRINKGITINYFLQKKIHQLIHETRTELFNSFKWLINLLTENFNLWESDILKINDIEYGKEFSLEVNGNQYYIWFLYWYNEEILNRLDGTHPNTILIFLYHPKFKILERNVFNPEIMHGIISFGEKNNVFSIGPKRFYQNLIQLFQVLDKKKDKRISIISPKEIEDYEGEDYDEIAETDKDIISQILNSEGQDGGKSRGDDDFWDIFEWDAETWKNFHLSGINSKKPLCIFLKAKNKNFLVDETIIKLISSEYKRKYGKLEAKHDIESISELDTISIIPENIVERLTDGLNIKKNKTTSSLNKIKNTKIFEDFLKELTDLMGQLDSTISGGERKLIIFRCNYDTLISDLFKKVTSILPNTHILKIKFDTFTEEIIQRIMNQLCWVLSLPRYNWRERFLISNDLININAIYTELERTNEKFYDDFGNDNDMNCIEKSWNGESDQHFNLKLPVYKYLKKYIGKKYDLGADLIKIEKRSEIDGGESEGVEPNTNVNNQPIPDLYVENKIWVEIETLLGFPDPRLLINEKFIPKKDYIKKCDEFWLVIPNFEIFMNKEKIRILLRRLFLLLNEEVIIKIFSIDYEKKTLKLWIFKSPQS